jgi:cytochrome c oxidase accessory protein FixG
VATIDPRSQGLGDCVDCTVCVQVCPTGIDIRKGLQLECIACAACIDACDSVMDRVGYPRGLIRYSTENALEGKPTRIVRPRTLIYGALLLALIVGFGIAVAQRQLLVVDVLRDRNALFREAARDTIENVYTVRLVNKDAHAHTVRLQVRGLPDATIDSELPAYPVGAGEVVTIPVRIRAPVAKLSGGRDIEIVARSSDAAALESATKTRFIAPVSPDAGAVRAEGAAR